MTEDDKENFKKRLPIAGFGVGAATGVYTHDSNRLANSKNRAVKIFNKARKSKVGSIVLPAAGGYAAYKGAVKATGKRMSPNKERTVGALTGGVLGSTVAKAVLKRSNALKIGLAGATGSLAGHLITSSNIKRRQNAAKRYAEKGI